MDHAFEQEQVAQDWLTVDCPFCIWERRSSGDFAPTAVRIALTVHLETSHAQLGAELLRVAVSRLTASGDTIQAQRTQRRVRRLRHQNAIARAAFRRGSGLTRRSAA